jgi:TolB-like protein
LNLPKSELKSTVALALKLQDQRLYQNLSEAECRDIASEMGVEWQDFQAAMEYNRRLARQKKIYKAIATVVGVALVFACGQLWSKRSIVTTGNEKQLQTHLAGHEQALEIKNKQIAQLVESGDISAQASRLQAKPKITLAVLPFTNQTSDPKLNGLAASCADAMLIPLSRSARITLIERMQLDKIMDEINLSQSKYVDPLYAIELGKLLNTDVAIMGALQIVGDSMRISARVVSSEDGKVIYSEKVEGPKSNFFALQDELAENLASRF